MTAQISDLFLYEQSEWSISAIVGGELFNPTHHGLETYPGSSACWSGYVGVYQILNDQLVIKDLLAFAKEPRPRLFGIAPIKSSEVAGFDTHYENLNAPLAFTGHLLIADHLIQRYYRHMGFHPAWKYKQVREFSFHQGALQEIKDRSSLMQELRQKMDRFHAGELHPADIEAMEQWWNEQLSGDYPLAM